MQKKEWTIAGIDYGSKMAGTTVIAHLKGKNIHLYGSVKKKDADAFILKWANENNPTYIFLDAPLSLPGVYTQMEGYDDYFYRRSDKALGAMSPMFLGGLTARAMKLKKQLTAQQIKILEVYPSQMATELSIKKLGYKKETSNITSLLKTLSPYLDSFHWNAQEINSWHHFDALLALISGIRFMQNLHYSVGSQEEGVIVV